MTYTGSPSPREFNSRLLHLRIKPSIMKYLLTFLGSSTSASHRTISGLPHVLYLPLQEPNNSRTSRLHYCSTTILEQSPQKHPVSSKHRSIQETFKNPFVPKVKLLLVLFDSKWYSDQHQVWCYCLCFCLVQEVFLISCILLYLCERFVSILKRRFINIGYYSFISFVEFAVNGRN